MKKRQIFFLTSLLINLLSCQKDQVELQYEPRAPADKGQSGEPAAAQQNKISISWVTADKTITHERRLEPVPGVFEDDKQIELRPELVKDLKVVVAMQEEFSGNVVLSAKTGKVDYWVDLVKDQIKGNTVTLSLSNYRNLLLNDGEEEFAVHLALNNSDSAKTSYEAKIMFHVIQPQKEIYLSWPKIEDEYGKKYLALAPPANKKIGILQDGQFVTLPARDIESLQVVFKGAAWLFNDANPIVGCEMLNLSTKEIIHLSTEWQKMDENTSALRVFGLSQMLTAQGLNEYTLSISIQTQDDIQYAYSINLRSPPVIEMAKFEGVAQSNLSEKLSTLMSGPAALHLLGILHFANASAQPIQIRLPRTFRASLRENSVLYTSQTVDSDIFTQAEVRNNTLLPETNFVAVPIVDGALVDLDMLKPELQLILKGNEAQQVALYGAGETTKEVIGEFYPKLPSAPQKSRHCKRQHPIGACLEMGEFLDGKQLLGVTVEVSSMAPALVSFGENEPFRVLSLIPSTMPLF